MRRRNGIIYLLHLDPPYKHAKHYLGWTDDLEHRLKEHRAGKGSPLVAAAIANGSVAELARLWRGTRTNERRLKNYGSAVQLCPKCSARPKPARGIPGARLTEPAP